jgi:hypothetical protein
MITKPGPPAPSRRVEVLQALVVLAAIVVLALLARLPSG